MWTDRQVTCCTAKAENGAMDDQFRRVLSVLFTVQERAEKQDNDKILFRMWGVYGGVIKMTAEEIRDQLAEHSELRKEYKNG